MAIPKKTTRAKTLAPSPSSTGKLGDLVALLTGKDGATIAQMVEKTDWQAHSVRGALAGALKNKGYVITSVKTEGVRVYRAEELKR